MINALKIFFFNHFFKFNFWQNQNILNQIENDHRIRNFAFIGPFSEKS